MSRAHTHTTHRNIDLKTVSQRRHAEGQCQRIENGKRNRNTRHPNDDGPDDGDDEMMTGTSRKMRLSFGNVRVDGVESLCEGIEDMLIC